MIYSQKTGVDMKSMLTDYLERTKKRGEELLHEDFISDFPRTRKKLEKHIFMMNECLEAIRVLEDKGELKTKIDYKKIIDVYFPVFEALESEIRNEFEIRNSYPKTD